MDCAINYDKSFDRAVKYFEGLAKQYEESGGKYGMPRYMVKRSIEEARKNYARKAYSREAEKLNYKVVEE